jgi:D-3-phosphoglycerate dehydrogenase / 2-oxoglutarate reductase
MKILNTIGSKYSTSAKVILEKLGHVDYKELSQENLMEIVGEYDILLVGLGLNIDKFVIERAKKLKYIVTATTGLDHIDVACAEQNGIKVVSLKGETEFLNTITGTAELAFGLLLDLSRQISPAFDSVKNNEWDREKFRGHNLYGKTLGIIGLGRLGRWMARYGQSFNMQVVAFDPYIDQKEFSNLGVKKSDFKDLLEQSDIVSIHVHLSPETENMFDKNALGLMRPDSYLINTSRGKIVNENDLLEALKAKKIAGYVADVLADELNFINNSFDGNPLVEYSKKNQNCIIVPHIGGMTWESREATDIFIAKKINEILNNKKKNDR